jgi:hypothetical protein
MGRKRRLKRKLKKNGGGVELTFNYSDSIFGGCKVPNQAW